MSRRLRAFSVLLLFWGTCCFAAANDPFPSDRDATGDRMIHAYLASEAERGEANCSEDVKSPKSRE